MFFHFKKVDFIVLNTQAIAHYHLRALITAVFLTVLAAASSHSHAQALPGINPMPRAAPPPIPTKAKKKTATQSKQAARTDKKRKPTGTSRRGKNKRFPLKRFPLKYGSSLVFEPRSGRIVHHFNIDQLTYPASLTKMMTAYVVFEAVREGRPTQTFTMESKLRFSPYARSQPATRVGLRKGIDVTIDTAVRALIIRSANDFAVALAETISGTETAFIERMNATARRLGMTHTNFVNPHGLPNSHQVSTARDFALLTSAIIRDFPQHAEVFSKPTVRIRNLTLHTHNSLLKNYEGADGMKTGFTCASGYNIVASATRNNRRLVVILIGALTGGGRNILAKDLLDAGFDRLNPTASSPATKDTTPAPKKAAPTKRTPAKTASQKTSTGKTKTASVSPQPVEPLFSDNVTLASLPYPRELSDATLDLTRKTRTWVCGNGPKPRRLRKRRKKSKKSSSKKSKKK